MNLSRRDFTKSALTALPALTGLAALHSSASAQARANPNRSYINGVQFGLQPFCYHDLAMNTQNRPELVRRLVQNGMGMVELHATWCEPRFDGPGVSAQEARQKLRNWRVSAPADYYRKIKREFDDSGITIFTYYVNISDADTDAEIDATFEAAKILGAQGCVGSYGLEIAHRLVPFPARHGLFVGLHNHDNLSDPDAFNTEQSFEKGLAFSPDFKATLDTRHFTAANGDCVGFLERHHQRVSSVHLGDRRKNNGRSTPFGEGDAPIIEVLRLIRDNRWPIVALLEFEHGTLRTEVEEVHLMFDYCKRALA
ncbi:MAG TPA: TIM barrel protein [Bryobacteraceae bacterium]|nr:TIM barrel protein [Bryobacteraceae bacterium]